MNLKIKNKWLLGDKLGQGSFGFVYAGTNCFTQEKVALKLESRTSKYSSLVYEAKVYR